MCIRDRNETRGASGAGQRVNNSFCLQNQPPENEPTLPSPSAPTNAGPYQVLVCCAAALLRQAQHTWRKKTFVFPICTPPIPHKSRKLAWLDRPWPCSPRRFVLVELVISCLETASLLSSGTTSKIISLVIAGVFYWGEGIKKQSQHQRLNLENEFPGHPSHAFFLSMNTGRK